MMSGMYQMNRTGFSPEFNSRKKEEFCNVPLFWPAATCIQEVTLPLRIFKVASIAVNTNSADYTFIEAVSGLAGQQSS
jgi:hypothetical protein